MGPPPGGSEARLEAETPDCPRGPGGRGKDPEQPPGVRQSLLERPRAPCSPLEPPRALGVPRSPPETPGAPGVPWSSPGPPGTSQSPWSPPEPPGVPQSPPRFLQSPPEPQPGGKAKEETSGAASEAPAVARRAHEASGQSVAADPLPRPLPDGPPSLPGFRRARKDGGGRTARGGRCCPLPPGESPVRLALVPPRRAAAPQKAPPGSRREAGPEEADMEGCACWAPAGAKNAEGESRGRGGPRTAERRVPVEKADGKTGPGEGL
ncbi:basic salivary proline-rich protein 1-like [Monodelphis domestica]|uniref:basic salivary proline-rich protein 1-like n=1 Tax=Monodelphis domestica TaxID=13616 RepID=UPI0024E1A4A9|nr:basic salivary proline-rich protein 1-like [Monodelphis domestica]